MLTRDGEWSRTFAAAMPVPSHSSATCEDCTATALARPSRVNLMALCGVSTTARRWSRCTTSLPSRPGESSGISGSEA